MPMPEASVHENGDPVSRKYDVWSARQVRMMEAKSQSQPVSNFADAQLGGSVLCPHA
jgi:hypothetical protein